MYIFKYLDSMHSLLDAKLASKPRAKVVHVCCLSYNKQFILSSLPSSVTLRRQDSLVDVNMNSIITFL